MTMVPSDKVVLETASCSGGSCRFGNLRGLQWRIDLGVLPSSRSASIDDLRRVTADSRRRYAALRRQLLIDPHVPKDGTSSPLLVIDNPLSQNPDSMWGRFFRNAELERMLDQDLARLYPERGSDFQASGRQGMLRRILLLWCLRNPEHGYRQGMHELLAPLLYVLQVDVERLLEVRKTYDNHFTDKFDGFSFHENDLTYKFDFKKFSEDGDESKNDFTKPCILRELDPETQAIVFLCDAYGAEGELGVVLSENFMEHDAYSMFDALMNDAGGAIGMAEFFNPSPLRSSHSGVPPVIEASRALYHLLSLVDSSLYSHLVELEVEPQYFALRWLRVLFGREFSLEDLLVIWDEIFSRENVKSNKGVVEDLESNFELLESPRGAFICAFAVSMILNLRSSLLATEISTAALQRLLNYPDDMKLVKLLEKAKSLYSLALNTNKSLNALQTHSGLQERSKAVVRSQRSLSPDSTSPRTPLNVVRVRDSYWEERWRVLQKEEENRTAPVEEHVRNRIKGWTERVRLRLSRTESDPTPSKRDGKTITAKPSVRRSLLKDLEQQLGSDEDKGNRRHDKEYEKTLPVEVSRQDAADKINDNTLSSSVSEENCSNFSPPASPPHYAHDNESERSSVASNSLVEENDAVWCGSNAEFSSLSPLPPVSDLPSGLGLTCPQNDDPVVKLEIGTNKKQTASNFRWLWNFGRQQIEEGTPGKGSEKEDAKLCNNGGDQKKNESSTGSCGTSKGETVNQNVMVGLKNLGQSMLENIQVIESVFQQDNLSKNGFVGKGQVTAMAALKELRNISNLLSEM